MSGARRDGEEGRKRFLFVCRYECEVIAEDLEEAERLMKPRMRPGPKNVAPPGYGYETGGARVERVTYSIVETKPCE